MRKYILLSLSLFLVGCASGPETFEANCGPQTVLHPAPPDQLKMLKVEWTLFNREKIEKLLADYPDQDFAIFALTARGYENLSLNMQEIIRYIGDQKDIIIFYRESFPAIEDLKKENNEQE